MSERDFFSEEAKRETVASVRAVEAQTSAEIVVAVRKRSGRYGVLAYHVGLGLAAVVTLYLLVVPAEYSVEMIAFEALLAFAIGSALAANFDTVLRLVSRPSTLETNVSTASRAAFYDLGISRTSGRSGILVYVSLFERRCTLVPDIGIVPGALEPGWASAKADLEKAVVHRDLPSFYRALTALGPVLGRVLPRSEDDVNELPDEVQ